LSGPLFSKYRYGTSPLLHFIKKKHLKLIVEFSCEFEGDSSNVFAARGSNLKSTNTKIPSILSILQDTLSSMFALSR